MNEAAPVLAQYGAIGLFALITGFVARELFKQVLVDKNRETDRADRAEASLADLNRSVREQVIPAALEMVSTTKALIELMAQERARRRE